MHDDQATGLRRLFEPRLLHTLAVCGSSGADVAVNLAAALARRGLRVLLLDRSRGNAAAILGLSPRYDLRHVLDGDKPLADVMLDAANGLYLLPAARGLERLAIESSDWRQSLQQAVPPLADGFDAWLVNGLLPGASPDAPVLLVLTPTARSITAAYTQIKALVRAQGRRRFSVVVHRPPSPEAGQQVFACVAETAARFLAADLELVGFIPREKGAGNGACLAAPQSCAGNAYRALADVIGNDLSTDAEGRLAIL